MSSPLARESAPLDAATLATLQAEIAKPRMTADKLRKRLVPPVSGATFWRALHGQKVSKPVQDACVAMARTIQADPDKPVVFKPVALSREHGVVQPVDSKVFSLQDAEDAIDFERAHTYDWDPDPEVA